MRVCWMVTKTIWSPSDTLEPSHDDWNFLVAQEGRGGGGGGGGLFLKNEIDWGPPSGFSKIIVHAPPPTQKISITNQHTPIVGWQPKGVGVCVIILKKINSSCALPLGWLKNFDRYSTMGVCWMATKFFGLPKKAWEGRAWNGNKNNGKGKKIKKKSGKEKGKKDNKNKGKILARLNTRRKKKGKKKKEGKLWGGNKKWSEKT